MFLLLHRLLLILSTGLIGGGLALARPDDAATVKAKIDKAKQTYDAEADKFKKSVMDIYDKREETARRKGDKKALDQIKQERDAFTLWGELPIAASKTELVEARSKMAQAYVDAQKEYLQLKLDDAVEALEKDHQEFLINSAILTGKKKYLSTLNHFGLKLAAGEIFSKTGTNGVANGEALKFRGESIPHSLYTPPPTSAAAQVSYTLAGKWTGLRTLVGVPSQADAAIAKDPESELTFEVLGDGKSLWKSKPVKKRDDFQECTVYLDKVKVLTLKVHCPNAHAFARAVWIEPILTEP